MKLLLKRIAKKEKYTIGKLYIDGEYFCDTVEDKDRELYSYMDVGEISRLKVYGETAIPYGTYKVRLSMSYKYKKILPEIMNIPGWTGVRIHSGNTAEDSLGCIIVGQNKAVGKVLNSRVTMNALMQKLEGQDDIEITIE